MLFSLVNISFSQIKLQGVVKDSIGNPLELANIIAINEETKALESYAITNHEGVFKLALSKNTTYALQVSYIGMKTHKETIDVKEEDINKDFSLISDNVLDEVELTYEMPVTVKGDTLIYNADSFKNGSERKLEDVIKNLPGVEINADGQMEKDTAIGPNYNRLRRVADTVRMIDPYVLDDQDSIEMYNEKNTLVSNQSRVYKGGGWRDMPYWMSPGSRRFLNENNAADDIGFRCAMIRMGSPTGVAAKKKKK